MRNIKAAVIGLGFMGRTHIQSLRRLGIEVCGVAGITPEEARKAAEELSIPRWYKGIEDALADKSINVVHLCTPNNLHYIHAKLALEAGKHIICEKPLALTSTESRTGRSRKEKRINRCGKLQSPVLSDLPGSSCPNSGR
jgi:predicted dehydrogenase